MVGRQIGAADRNRTCNIQLGKMALYQLSYYRIAPDRDWTYDSQFTKLVLYHWATRAKMQSPRVSMGQIKEPLAGSPCTAFTMTRPCRTDRPEVSSTWSIHALRSGFRNPLGSYTPETWLAICTGKLIKEQRHSNRILKQKQVIFHVRTYRAWAAYT